MKRRGFYDYSGAYDPALTTRARYEIIESDINSIEREGSIQMAKFCMMCGKKQERDDARFCMYCGESLGAAAPAVDGGTAPKSKGGRILT